MFIDEVEDEDGSGEVDLETLEDCLPPSDIFDYFVSKHSSRLLHPVFSIGTHFS